MSDVKRYSIVTDSLDIRAQYVLASDYEALAQQCSEYERIARLGENNGQVLVSTLSTVSAERDDLRADVADLKARLLESERGAEDLVRLRAENRELVERIQKIVTTPHESKEALARRVRQILEEHRK